MASPRSDSESWSDVMAPSDDEHSFRGRKSPHLQGWEKIDKEYVGGDWFASKADSFMGMMESLKAALHGGQAKEPSSSSTVAAAAAVATTEPSTTDKSGYTAASHSKHEGEKKHHNKDDTTTTASESTLTSTSSASTQSTTTTKEEEAEEPSRPANRVLAPSEFEQEDSLPTTAILVNPQAAAAAAAPSDSTHIPATWPESVHKVQATSPSVVVSTVYAVSTVMPGSYPRIDYNAIDYGSLGEIGVFVDSAAGLDVTSIWSSFFLCALVLLMLSRT